MRTLFPWGGKYLDPRSPYSISITYEQRTGFEKDPRLPGRGAGGYSGPAMAVTVRYFASLRERMGRGEDRLPPPLPATVDEVWSRVGGGEPLAGNVLTAVNLEYVDPGHPVADGDEVAFFPPVTGG